MSRALTSCIFPILKIITSFDWLMASYARGFNQSEVVIIFKPGIIVCFVVVC